MFYNQHMQRIAEIKSLMGRGDITYDEAKEMAKPILNDMNEKAEKIAKKFGRKHIKFTFSGVFR